jgi:ABC-type uncharacterized transport system permease subunit
MAESLVEDYDLVRWRLLLSRPTVPQVSSKKEFENSAMGSTYLSANNATRYVWETLTLDFIFAPDAKQRITFANAGCQISFLISPFIIIIPTACSIAFTLLVLMHELAATGISLKLIVSDDNIITHDEQGKSSLNLNSTSVLTSIEQMVSC